MINGFDIICISGSDWEHPWGSKQQIMSRLALKNRILYVEYQANFMHIFRTFVKKRLIFLFGKLRKVNDNLYIYTPPLCFLPFGYYFRIINRLNQKILSILVHRKIKKIGFKEFMFWIYHPSAVDLIKYFKFSFIIYHCIADFPHEKNNPLRRNTMFSMENELVRKSDIIAAMTEDLYRRFSKANGKVIYFPSAVDFEYFYKKSTEKLDMPEDLKKIKKPVLGIVGYLDAKVFDLELLEHLVTSRSQWSLVLIGPIFRDSLSFKRLRSKNNVYFLGGKKYYEVPSYIKFLDVCLIPYKKNKFTENVSPLKLYEYLSFGKPVVSTDFLKNELPLDLIRIAGDREEFIENIELSLSELDSSLSRRRIEFARDNSWDKRVEAVSQFIENIKNERN